LDFEQSEEPRAEALTAALIYLMTQHARTGCPRLALCVSRHMQCLASHPDAAPVLKEICAGLHGAWSRAAQCGHHEAPEQRTNEALH
jgi:hypothetical protein